MASIFDKPFEAKSEEERIYRLWEGSGYFTPEKLPGTRKTVFSMVLPPPNVTGTLHLGHAFEYTLQDILVRFHRMKGDTTLWIPGTDHAAIATQEKVEKELYKKEGKSRHDLGREAFLRRVEQFAKESHDTIVRQMRATGASLDWSREAFTLDEARSLAVRTAFKKMYEAGLIYRGERIVNWDPKLQTTVSDEEIEWREEKSPFYYIQYGPFTIATARPETKFGDKYVVMHPDDKRYKQYQEGQKLDVEWINGKITATVIKDKAVDPKFGTGVMTITPWHDAIDFEIAERHKLDREQIIDLRGKLLPIAGEFAGKKITEARPLIVEKLKTKGLLVKVDEAYTHRVATDSRGGGVIEPQILKQWFVDVNKKFRIPHSKIKGIKSGSETTLKEIMTKSVKGGQIKILPERFKKIYFHWINNLRDWCISRQIWYGHRIPVWYCAGCGEIKVDSEIKTRWFFVRHGETDWNKEKRSMGQKDIPLNEVGSLQARHAAEALKDKKIDLIISSDLKRCTETAEIIQDIVGGEVIFDKNLRERSYGEAEGILRDEIRSKYGDLFTYESKPPGGESYKEVEERAWSAFVRHRNSHGYKNVVIVSHGGTIRTLLKRIKNWDSDRMFANKAVENAEIIQFDILDPCSRCGSHLYKQDPDTLDTWFSSGLWTFSTLGWPFDAAQGKPTADFKMFHPTNVIAPGYEILFFWVARMILMSGFLLGDIPFRAVFLHGIVRDKQGRKFSKSLGNGIDPLELIEKYGADALRMALVVSGAPGSDIKFDEDRVRGYRNFTTKIWNIARFIAMSESDELKGVKPKFTPADRKRQKEFASVKAKVTKAIETFRFHEAGETIYHYLWHTFADKIIEETKDRLKSSIIKERAAAHALLRELFMDCLTLLHPFMPFVTEAIYQDYFRPRDPKLPPFLVIKEW